MPKARRVPSGKLSARIPSGTLSASCQNAFAVKWEWGGVERKLLDYGRNEKGAKLVREKHRATLWLSGMGE